MIAFTLNKIWTHIDTDSMREPRKWERAETWLNCSLNGGKQVSNNCFVGLPTTTTATQNSFHAVLGALYAVQHIKNTQYTYQKGNTRKEEEEAAATQRISLLDKWTQFLFICLLFPSSMCLFAFFSLFFAILDYWFFQFVLLPMVRISFSTMLDSLRCLEAPELCVCASIQTHFVNDICDDLYTHLHASESHLSMNDVCVLFKSTSLFSLVSADWYYEYYKSTHISACA